MLKCVFLILDLGHGSEATALNYTANFSFISEKIQCTYDAFYWKITITSIERWTRWSCKGNFSLFYCLGTKPILTLKKDCRMQKITWLNHFSFTGQVITECLICAWQCVCMLSHFSGVQLFVTLWTINLPGSSVHGILQAKILEWVAMTSSSGSSWLRDQTPVSCITDRFFTSETLGKAAWKCAFSQRHLDWKTLPPALRNCFLSVLSVSLAGEASASWPVSLSPGCPWLPNSIQTPEMSF